VIGLAAVYLSATCHADFIEVKTGPSEKRRWVKVKTIVAPFFVLFVVGGAAGGGVMWVWSRVRPKKIKPSLEAWEIATDNYNEGHR
jgi:hypothetical protein